MNERELAFRTGIFPHTLHVIPETCDVSEQTYFKMCFQTIGILTRLVKFKNDYGYNIQPRCITTSLSIKPRNNHRLEHLHSWICFEDELIDKSIKKDGNLELINQDFVQAFRAYPKTGTSSRTKIGVGRSGWMTQNPFESDVQYTITGDSLRRMLSSQENYAGYFKLLYERLTNKRYEHGTSVCFTFLKFEDGSPVSFTLAVAGTEVVASRTEAVERKQQFNHMQASAEDNSAW